MKKLILITLIFFFTTFAMAMDLIPCKEEEIKGSFNLIIYSNMFINDPETFIILDKEDNVTIRPYAPDFKFKIFERLNDKEALKITKEILINPAYVSFIKCSKIVEGNYIFGYEIKPIYYPWIFGILEPVETTYKKEDSYINVFIKLNPRVEKQIYNGGQSERED